MSTKSNRRFADQRSAVSTQLSASHQKSIVDPVDPFLSPINSLFKACKELDYPLSADLAPLFTDYLQPTHFEHTHWIEDCGKMVLKFPQSLWVDPRNRCEYYIAKIIDVTKNQNGGGIVTLKHTKSGEWYIPHKQFVSVRVFLDIMHAGQGEPRRRAAAGSDRGQYTPEILEWAESRMGGQWCQLVKKWFTHWLTLTLTLTHLKSQKIHKFINDNDS